MPGRLACRENDWLPRLIMSEKVFLMKEVNAGKVCRQVKVAHQVGADPAC